MSIDELNNLNINDIVVYTNDFDYLNRKTFTYGKKYIVRTIFINLGCICLMNNFNDTVLVDRRQFTTLKQYEIIHRKDKIRKLLYVNK